MEIDFDTTVIGAGVVGLAIAAQIARKGKNVIVIETNPKIGQETSSRNSGVIHAGIYYSKGSLKAKTCLRGKMLLYEFLEKRKIPFRRLGKYIIANSDERNKLDAIFVRGIDNGVHDLKFIDKRQLKKEMPGMRADMAIFSPSSGILDVHAYMDSLMGEIVDNGGNIAFISTFLNAKQIGTEFPIWKLEVLGNSNNAHTSEIITITSRSIVNAAGLLADEVARKIEGLSNNLIPKIYFVKGNYFSVKGKCPFDSLIYPLPEKGGLGTHLTLDMGNQAILGPDVEPIENSNDNSNNQQIFDYSIDEKRSSSFYKSGVRWWPTLQETQLFPAYSGIRPKLRKITDEPADFLIQTPKTTNIANLVNLFGIESPGLTASLAIAELVGDVITTD